MQIELDPPLLEEAVFLGVHSLERAGDRDVPGAYREAVDPLYEEELDEDGRNLAFRRVHERFFARLGFEEGLEEILAAFPLLESELDRIVLLKASKAKEERAELFVREDEDRPGELRRTAVVKILARRFRAPESYRDFLSRELYHVSDMVDPAFAYSPEPLAEDEEPGTQNLIRDRYHVLWRTYILGRLARLRGEQGGPREDVGRLFEQVFRGLGADGVRQLYELILSSDRLSHSRLAELARSGLES